MLLCQTSYRHFLGSWNLFCCTASAVIKLHSLAFSVLLTCHKRGCQDSGTTQLALQAEFSSVCLSIVDALTRNNPVSQKLVLLDTQKNVYCGLKCIWFSLTNNNKSKELSCIQVFLNTFSFPAGDYFCVQYENFLHLSSISVCLVMLSRPTEHRFWLRTMYSVNMILSENAGLAEYLW